uniref:RNA-binding S4 domain-containing protein n=1 Tax=Panagrolaimus sp. JU765 TaxID=591449 RepID=A0AC34QQ24_9BILA
MLRQVFRSLVQTMPKQRLLIQNQPVFHQSFAQISISNPNFAKKKKRGTKNQKVELVEVEEDDDDVDDNIDEKTAMAAKGILHKGVGEAEEVVDDGLPKDYKRRVLKLGSRRLDTLLNRTSGKSSAEVEKMILTGRVRINEQIVKKKAHNINKKDEIDVWLESLAENPALANVHRVKIVDYVLKQSGYDIDAMIWSKVIVENWKQQEWSAEAT